MLVIRINGKDHPVTQSKPGVKEHTPVIPDTKHPSCKGLTVGFCNVPPANTVVKSERPLYMLKGDFSDQEIRSLCADPWQIFKPLTEIKGDNGGGNGRLLKSLCFF